MSSCKDPHTPAQLQVARRRSAGDGHRLSRHRCAGSRPSPRLGEALRTKVQELLRTPACESWGLAAQLAISGVDGDLERLSLLSSSSGATADRRRGALGTRGPRARSCPRPGWRRNPGVWDSGAIHRLRLDQFGQSNLVREAFAQRVDRRQSRQCVEAAVSNDRTVCTNCSFKVR